MTDTAQTGVDIAAALRIEVGNLSSSIDGLRRQVEDRKRLVPMDFDAQASGQAPAAGVLTLGLGQPSAGRIWEVRNWCCGGVTWATPAAGLAVIGATAAYGRLQGGQAGTAPAIVTSEVQDKLAALPDVRQIGTRQVVVLPGESLAVIVQGGTSGQTYAAHAYVLDYPLDAELVVPGGAV